MDENKENIKDGIFKQPSIIISRSKSESDPKRKKKTGIKNSSSDEEIFGLHSLQTESVGFVKDFLARDSLGFRTEALGFSRESFTFGRESMGFGRESMGFGRESLGFGKESLGFGRESLGFRRESLGFGRESLSSGRDSFGLRRKSSIYGRESFGFERESLGILDLNKINSMQNNFLTSDVQNSTISIFKTKSPSKMHNQILLSPDFGRESLGILKSEIDNFSFCCLNSMDCKDLLNEGFLLANSAALSPVASSVSFNSASLNQHDFSTISSINGIDIKGEFSGDSVLNKAFVNSRIDQEKIRSKSVPCFDKSDAFNCWNDFKCILDDVKKSVKEICKEEDLNEICKTDQNDFCKEVSKSSYGESLSDFCKVEIFKETREENLKKNRKEDNLTKICQEVDLINFCDNESFKQMSSNCNREPKSAEIEGINKEEHSMLKENVKLQESPDLIFQKPRIRPRAYSAAAEITSETTKSYKNRLCSSAKKSKKPTPIFRSSSFDNISSVISDNVFEESIFIEAKYLSAKIADGSILNESYEGKDILESTPQPNWEDLDQIEEPEKKSDPNSVLKTLDKILPQKNVTFAQNDKNTNLRKVVVNAKSKILKSNLKENNNSRNSSKDCQSFSSSSSRSGSKSLDKKQILQDLSSIVSLGNYDEKKKKEAQKLITSIAEILLSENSREVEKDEKIIEREISVDIHSQKHELLYEAKSEEPKFEKNLQEASEKLESKIVKSNENKSNEKLNVPVSNFNSVKTKKVTISEGFKKGPLKAIVPVDNMVKSSSRKSCGIVTPKKLSSTVVHGKNTKKTSTPIETKLKPMAHSTPDNIETLSPKTSRLSKLPIMSPLTRNTSMMSSGSDSNRSGNISINKSNKSYDKVEKSSSKISGLSRSFAGKREKSDLDVIILNENKNLDVNQKGSDAIKKEIAKSQRSNSLSLLKSNCTSSLPKDSSIMRKSSLNNIGSGNRGDVPLKRKMLPSARRGSFSGMKPVNLIDKMKTVKK